MKKGIRFIAAFSLVAIVCMLKSPTYADASATVIAESAYIRTSASTDAEIAGGAMKNDVLTIIGSDKDSNGMEWYKVKLFDGTVGFVRSDLVKKDGEVSTNTENDTAGGDGNTAEVQATVKPDVSEMTPDTTGLVEVEKVVGTVLGDVNVRKGPSQNTEKVTQAPTDTMVNITGYDKDESGKIWYKVDYKVDEKSVDGYIRSDFLNIKFEDLVEKKEEVPEAEPSLEPTPEPPAPTPETEAYSYAITTELDGNGDTVYVLQDFDNGKKYKVSEVISAKEELTTVKNDYEQRLKKKTILSAVLIIVIVLLLAAAVFAVINFRQWYFGYDDDEFVEPDVSRNVQKVNASQSGTKPLSVKPEQKMQTVGSASQQTSSSGKAKDSAVYSSLPEGTVKLPDGRIQLPDGTVRKAVVGVRMPDGSIKLADGRIRKTDGTIVAADDSASAVQPSTSQIRSGSTSKEVHKVSYSQDMGADDDDMEFGFLNFDGNSDD